MRASTLLVFALLAVAELAPAHRSYAASTTTAPPAAVAGSSTSTGSVSAPSATAAPASKTATPGGGSAGGAAAPATGGTTTYVPSDGATPAPTTRVPNGAIPTTTAPAPGAGLAGAQAQASRSLGAPARARHAKHGLSTLAIVLAALGGLLVLASAAWAIARERGWEPHWWLSLRHAMAEAGFRASETWAEFADWARLGH